MQQSQSPSASQTAPKKRLARYRGSSLLLSGLDRFLLVLVPVAFLWLVAGWALGWW